MALTDDIRAYIAALGHSPRQELGSVQDGRILVLGEDHDALFRSLEILEALVGADGYRYFANEWFLNAGAIRQGLRSVWRGGDLPEGRPRNREERGLRARYGPWVPVLRRLRQRRLFHLAIGSRTTGRIRDRRIAAHYIDEVVDRGLGRRSRGIALLGASHACEVPFYRGIQTTRQILQGYGWVLTSARIFEGGPRVTEGFGSAEEERGHVVPLTGGNSFLLADLLPNGVNQLAVQIRQQHAGKPSPFYSIGEMVRTGTRSGRSVAEQYEIAVVTRDS